MRHASPPQLRAATIGDASGCAALWVEAGRYYAALDPENYQIPEASGLSVWFAQAIQALRDDHRLLLVAEYDGRVVGFVDATIRPPHEEAPLHLLRDLGRARISIDALAVTASYRRQGIGTRLLAAAEGWGRERGAAVCILSTSLHSSVVAFYERLAYRRNSLLFRKVLAETPSSGLAPGGG